ncbi:terminase small subunit [Larkinella soli]|uniref:terminase small subunit n=1 Tax=Larkinella soli TaxID=1770527 RepID=UPI000FFC4BD8|nr:terminase small subunit [Larkinella soli]
MDQEEFSPDQNAPDSASEPDEYAPWYEGLTLQQQQFVEEYCKHGKGAEAARKAGYSEHTAKEQASRLLTNVNLLRAIKRYFEERSMSVEEAIDKLTTWGRGTLHPFLYTGEVSLDTPLARENIGLLKEVEQVKTTHYSETGSTETVKTKIKLNDPMTAVRNILEVRGKIVRKIEHSGPGGAPIPIDDVTKLTDEELRTRIAALRATIRAGTVSEDSGEE